MKFKVHLPADTSGPVVVKDFKTPHFLEKRQQDAMLAWAAERDISHVVFEYGPTHNVKVSRCLDCGEPREGICDYCFMLRHLSLGGDQGMSAEELEYRAQLAERMSVEFAKLSIDLQARAAAATPDPIEIEVVPPNPMTQLNELMSRMIKQGELHWASGAALDKWAEVQGLKRSLHGGFSESDDSLRRRIRISMNPKKQSFMVAMDSVHGLRVGDVLQMSGSDGAPFDAKVTGVQVNQNGVVEVTYEATLPTPIPFVSISGTVDL